MKRKTNQCEACRSLAPRGLRSDKLARQQRRRAFPFLGYRKPVARYNLGRHNKSLDASGGSVLLNLLGAAKGALIRAAASTQPLDAFMILRSFQISIVALALLLFSLAPVSAQTVSIDPLKPYTACKMPGDLKVKEVRRRNPDSNYREVVTATGKEKVSVVDGYRVMFAYSDLTYYFANIKIEQSTPDSYAQDKRILVNQLKYQSTPPKTFVMTFEGKDTLNSFEHYGIDRDKIDTGDEVGMHVLFYDPVHLVVTVYFLNQSKAVFANNRRFETIKQFRELRDEFLSHYSECLKRVADAQH